MATREYIFSAFVAAIGTIVSTWLGGWDGALSALIFFMIVDYTTGLLGAIKTKSVDSEVMFWGGIRKAIILVVISIAIRLDGIIGNQEPIFRMMALYYYIGREGWSITENLGILGVPLPAKLKKVLVQLQEKGGE